MVTWVFFGAAFIALASIAVSFALGSLRGGAAFIGAAWLILLAMWLQHWIVSARPGYNAGPGGGLGIIMMTMFALGVAIGTAAFGVLAAWWKNK